MHVVKLPEKSLQAGLIGGHLQRGDDGTKRR